MRDLAFLAAVLVTATPALAETFTPPDGPITLTRTVSRVLPDGKEVVATRNYEVRIVRDDDGYRVEGRLLSAAVQAPPSLETLAAIERQRSDERLFPFRLDPQGLIASPTAPGDRSAAEAAGTAAREAIANGPLSAARQREAEAFVGQIVANGSAGSGARWPADLFRPAFGRHTARAAMTFPGGQAGSVTTTVDATRDSSSDRIERTVVTETGGSRRTTREIYTLSRSLK